VHPAERAERDALLLLAAVPGMDVLEVGGAACVAVPAMPEVPMVNHTVGAGEDEDADDATLAAIAAFYGRVRARYYVAVTPSARPADLRERLAAHGFTRGYDWMKFVRGTDDVPRAETELDVRPVGPGEGDDFADVVVAGYEMPSAVRPAIAAVPRVAGCFAYAAYAGAEAAAAGALFVSGDLGWLGFAATRPEHRRKGGQGAVLAARIARARELGVKTLVTETGVIAEGRPSNSYRNILRTGFEEVYVRENYLSPPAAMAAS
jgi:GNAT superfamily N-acetyltransferase